MSDKKLRVMPTQRTMEGKPKKPQRARDGPDPVPNSTSDDGTQNNANICWILATCGSQSLLQILSPSFTNRPRQALLSPPLHIRGSWGPERGSNLLTGNSVVNPDCPAPELWLHSGCSFRESRAEYKTKQLAGKQHQDGVHTLSAGHRINRSQASNLL